MPQYSSGHDFLCYNIRMGRNVSDLLVRSLNGAHLEILHLLAYQASMLRMPIYLVGGVVRDILLGQAVKDFDLVVEGRSAEFAEYIVKKFGGRIVIHSKFGTATWMLNESTYKRLNVPMLDMSASPLSFDLISARSESYSQPGALPKVKPSTIGDDLRRRDITINAMAIQLDGERFGELYDPLNGEKDLNARLIRVIQDESFIDDPTRIFRAVRYAARYGFDIEPETSALINQEAFDILVQLSGERLRHEFDLIFEEKHSIVMMAQFETLGVLHLFHPDLQFSNYKSPLDYQLAPEFADLVIPDMLSFHQTLAWILWLISLPVTSIEAIAKRLAFPAVLTYSAIAASKIILTPYPPDASISQKTFYLDAFPPLAVYAAWIMSGDGSVRENLNKYLLEWRNIKPYTSGYILQQRGLVPGPKFKEILTRLRAAWLDGEVNTEEEEVKLLNNLLIRMV